MGHAGAGDKGTFNIGLQYLEMLQVFHDDEIGAVAGTFGGYEFRVRLVKAIGGKDLPIALLEDLIAVGGAILIVNLFS